MDAAESPVGVKDRESVGEWRFVLAIYVNRYRCGFIVISCPGTRNESKGLVTGDRGLKGFTRKNRGCCLLEEREVPALPGCDCFRIGIACETAVLLVDVGCCEGLAVS